jgi:hypothetical protein
MFTCGSARWRIDAPKSPRRGDVITTKSHEYLSERTLGIGAPTGGDRSMISREPCSAPGSNTAPCRARQQIVVGVARACTHWGNLGTLACSNLKDVMEGAAMSYPRKHRTRATHYTHFFVGLLAFLAVTPGALAAPPDDARGTYTGSGTERATGCRDSRYAYTFPFSVTMKVPAQTGPGLSGAAFRSGTIRDNAALNGQRATESASLYTAPLANGSYETYQRSTTTLAGLTQTSNWEPGSQNGSVRQSGNTFRVSRSERDASTGCLVTMSYSVTRSGSLRLPVSTLYSAFGDFDGDGNADILFRHGQSGQVVIWRMSGLGILQVGVVGTPNPVWELHGIGDLNGDGRSDLVWRNGSTGALVVWLMNGTSIVSSTAVSSPSTVWQLQAVDDFDADGRADLLWRNSTNGAIFMWRMDGTTILGTGYVSTTIGLTTRIVGTGDLDGDGRADIVMRLNDSTVSALLMNGTTIASQGNLAIPATLVNVNSAAWQVFGVGDFDGDAKADLLWRNTATGNVVVNLLDGLTVVSLTSVSAVGGTSAIYGVGDLNGDGRHDIVFRNGQTVVGWLMNGATLSSSAAISNADPMWLID